MKTKPKLFKVEMAFTYGWDDADWSVSHCDKTKPMRFGSRLAAQNEINEFISDCAEAVKRGDMETGHTRSEFRVVPAS